MSIKSYFNEIKEYRRKERQKKKDDKALLKRLEQEEKELEINVEEANDDFDIKVIIDAIKKDPELDEELHSYLTEEEKATLKETEKEGRRLTIIIASTLGIVLIAAITGMILLSHQEGGTVLEILTPKIEEYIKNERNSGARIVSIEQITERTEDNLINDTNMYVAYTTNDKHIVTFEDNEIYADDFDNKEIYNSYKEDLKNIRGDFTIISSTPTISHKDFYYNYNLQTSYIKALPKDQSYEDLKASGKLTITDVIMYQGNINFQDVKTIINKLSDDSKIILIKNEKGFPTAVSFISKTEYFTLNVISNTEPMENINYYQLDQNLNKVTNLNITKINNNKVEAREGYEVKNAYTITYDNRASHTPDGKEKAEYFFISMDKSLFDANNVIIYDTNETLDRTYQEENLYDYPFLVTANIGGKTYIIGTSQVGIANIVKKDDSFLCKIGLC